MSETLPFQSHWSHAYGPYLPFQWSTVPKPFALQTLVRELKTLEGSYTKFRSVGDLFSSGSHCFILATDSYAAMGKVRVRRGS